MSYFPFVVQPKHISVNTGKQRILEDQVVILLIFLRFPNSQVNVLSMMLLDAHVGGRLFCICSQLMLWDTHLVFCSLTRRLSCAEASTTRNPNCHRQAMGNYKTS
jgi:hypothetical protein